jgi:hypothetical protein
VKPPTVLAEDMRGAMKKKALLEEVFEKRAVFSAGS